MNGVAAIGLEHCAQEPTTLMMKETESLPKDEFHIIDIQSENIAFQVKGRVLSRRDKKQLLDTHGNEIARFKITIISLHKIFRVYTHSKENFMAVKRKFGAEKSKMVAEIKNICDDGRIMKIEVVGDWKGKNAVISEEGGEALATVSRKHNVEGSLLDDQAYYLNVNVGVDMAMVVLLALAFDELEDDSIYHFFGFQDSID
jgi:uncharacterized protein YxjI